MRKLTLKRKWSLIECASRIYLYVQSSIEQADAEIDGIDCRALGRLKNGKTVTVDIPDDATAVFVVSSTMQASYTIPAGTADVSLLAKPSYNPAQGNPFTISEN